MSDGFGTRAEEIFRGANSLESRPGQRILTRMVEEAIERQRPLIVEAGTGIGKTLGYLIPALLSGKRVVVSTGTRALQDQLLLREVPRAFELLGRELAPGDVTLMKGLSNYLCKRRLAAALGAGDPRLLALASWERETEDGDVAELDLGESDPAWRLVQSGSETRVGSGCQHYESCFVTRMKRRAEDASLVVVNHHLYFADLALRSGPKGAYASVIPPHDVVVFDEAHQLEDVAMLFFGLQISMARIEGLAREAERLGVTREPAGAALVRSLREQGDALLRAVKEWPDGRVELPKAEVLAVRDAAMSLSLSRAEGDDAHLFRRRASELASDVTSIGRAEGQVVYVDRSAAHPIIRSTPLSVGPILSEQLFERVPTVVLTSATLASVDAAGPSMQFVRSQLGVPNDAKEAMLPSPFDVAGRALFYVPNDLPEPSSPTFEEESADRAISLAELTQGGALILTTSFRALTTFTRVFRSRWRGDLFVQGDGSKSRLLAAFRKSHRGALLATLGFWEGVDVPGDALRLVVMDKVPFGVPTDPVLRARSRVIEARGENPFMKLSVPAATILLKQGFGRLLRGDGDFGIVALLDRRVADRPYGRKIRAALPQAPLVRDRAVLEGKWNELLARTSVPPVERAFEDFEGDGAP